jgi:diguanylate cyclase (GGDEF)-like protein
VRIQRYPRNSRNRALKWTFPFNKEGRRYKGQGLMSTTQFPRRAKSSPLRRISRSLAPSPIVAPGGRQLSDILSEFARTLLTDFPIQGILDHLVGRIVETMPITSAGVTLISETVSPHYVAASDGAALAYVKLQTALEEGPCIVAYRTGKAVAIPDLRDEDRFPLFGPQALEAGLGAVFTFPLCQGGIRLGALDLYRDTPGPLSDEAMVVAQTLADVASAYLVNAQVRADLLDSSARANDVALHDALTGLPNRALLIERIEHALRSSRRSKNVVAVLFIDLDRFKRVNDSYGHQVGDDLLVAVATRLTSMLRPGDTLARLSGDEFIIVCEDLDEEDQVEGIATRLAEAISSPFELGRAAVDLTASIGIAFAAPDSNPEQLLHKADIAMYQVKRKGGAQHHVIDVHERELTEYNDSLQRDLGHAVVRSELRLDYQPIVRVEDGRVISVEALLRWDHPEQGPITPAVLVPLAEQSGDIIGIGQWVLERACIDRHRWEDKTGDGALVMAVNVSAHQLMSSDFVAMVEGILAATDTQAKHLCLEVTESAFLEDSKRALAILSCLNRLGVRVALDDFGTGYSSLSYLREYPVDIIKIDQSFIADLTEDTSSRAIVAKTIELAHLLKLIVVCEGVETIEQYRCVSALRSDFCQGFYFSRPMAAETIDDTTDSAATPWTIAA